MGCGASVDDQYPYVSDVVDYDLPEPIVSAFNEGYACTVTKLCFSERGVTLHFHVIGDGSKGHLQDASNSTLTWGDHAAWEPYVCKKLEYLENEPLNKKGCITFGLYKEQPWGPLYFSYGESGYKKVVLVNLTQQFALNNGLGIFRWSSK